MTLQYDVSFITHLIVPMELSIRLSTAMFADKRVFHSAEIVSIMLPVLLQLSELIAAEADPLALAKAGKLLNIHRSPAISLCHFLDSMPSDPTPGLHQLSVPCLVANT